MIQRRCIILLLVASYGALIAAIHLVLFAVLYQEVSITLALALTSPSFAWAVWMLTAPLFCGAPKVWLREEAYVVVWPWSRRTITFAATNCSIVERPLQSQGMAAAGLKITERALLVQFLPARRLHLGARWIMWEFISQYRGLSGSPCVAGPMYRYERVLIPLPSEGPEIG